MEFFFDVETSGFHKDGIEPTNPSQAWTVQIGFILSTKDKIYQECCAIFRPPFETCSIHPAAEKTHGISLDDCLTGGVSENSFFDYFANTHVLADTLVCHNWNFDKRFAYDMIFRMDCKVEADLFIERVNCCTMLSSTDYCKLPGRWNKPKWPKLEELHRHLFDEDFEGAHDALADVRATRRCYYELRERKVL